MKPIYKLRKTLARPDAWLILVDSQPFWSNIACIWEFKKEDTPHNESDVRASLSPFAVLRLIRSTSEPPQGGLERATASP